MTTTEEQAKPLSKANLLKAADYRSLYINWVQPSFTPFDISMVIGQAGNREQEVFTDPAIVDIEIKAKISFHPAEARLIALLLLQSINNYEKQFGKIPIPTGVVTPQVNVAEVVG